uniref:Mannosyltransferase n=1 Tax=Strongyloides venezuelensis TaxID=75913 RepID=A0A0K0FA21_STRVS
MARKNINTVIRRNNRIEKAKSDRKVLPSTSQPTYADSKEPEEKLYFPSDSYDTDTAPGCNSVLKIIISLRISSAFYGLIMDCDEVYNYWEPLHLFLYGNGLQTWEYSPLYAIRSYFYIFLHSLPAHIIMNLSSHSKIFIFYAIRCILGIICASSDTILYYSLCKKFSNSIGIIYIVFTLLAPGMFISSTAFLPSSFSMVLCTLTIAAYLREKYFIAIFCTATSALLGWPFAAVLGFPIVAHMVFIHYKKYMLKFILYSVLSGTLISTPMIYFDSLYFGKTVFAPLNIVLYNVFSSHGPDLYGTAPLTYYLKNLFLNWNIGFPLLFLSLPLSWLAYNKVRRDNAKYFKKINYESFIPLLLIFCTLMLWFAIFFLQPHKEERFMFPVYPLIAILASVAVDGIAKLFKNSTVLILLLLAVFGGFSITRNIALTKYYSAPTTIFKEFNDYLIEHSQDLDFSVMQDPVNLCMGDEWYEFPSSFFLPHQIADRFNRKRTIKLQFIRSGFKGLLPKYYEQGKLLDVTRKIPADMNDQNKEETSRYVSLSSCDYIVKLNKGSDNIYKELSKEFVPIIKQPYLNVDKTSSAIRAFYTPLYSDDALHWASYEILKHR